MSLAEQKALQSLALLRSEVDALATQVEVVVKSASIGIAPAQQQAALLHELMTQALLKLDRITGDGEVRNQRKAEVRRVNELSAQLDKAESRHLPAPSSSQVTAASARSLEKLEETHEQEAQPPTEPEPLAAVFVPPAPAPQPAPHAEPSLVVTPASSSPAPAATLSQPSVAPSASVSTPSSVAAPVSKPATAASPPPVAPKSSIPQPFSAPPAQKSPSRSLSPAAMAGPPPRQAGEDVRKRAAGMMSHALSFSDGLATIKPPPIEKKQSLASSAVAAFTAQQVAPKSTPSAATPPPLAPTISERLDDLSLSAAPPLAPTSSVPSSGSLHDLDSFFGGRAAPPPPAMTAPQAAPPSVPNFANFDTVGQQQQPQTINTPPLSQSPAQTPPAVAHPPQSGARLSFPSPPKPAVPFGRSSTTGGPFTPPQEPPRPALSKPPVLGNLSGFASTIPPPKPAVRESPPVSPAVSSFSPPPAALSSFTVDAPSPATRSNLTRPSSQPNLPQIAAPPPASGMRRSLQANSIEEALRTALSRRESVGKETPPGSFNAKAEPAPPAQAESSPAPSSQAGVAQKASPPTSAPGSSSTWVAFDSDFDPRGFSGSAKSSPTVSRRSSYELPPPPRPAQPLFPELAPNGEQSSALTPAVSLLDNTPVTTGAPPTRPADPTPAPSKQPVAPAPGPQAAPVGPSLGAPSSEQPQPVPARTAASASQASFEAAFPANFSAPPQGAQGAGQQGAAHNTPSSQVSVNAGVNQQGSGPKQPGSLPQAAGVLQAGVAQQPTRPPQQAAPPGQGFAPQAFPQQQNWGAPQGPAQQPFAQQQSWGGTQQGSAQAGPARPPSSSPAEAASLSVSAPVGARASGPLEGFGETGLQQFARPPLQQAYGAAGWPQQGFAANPRPGFAPQGFSQQGYGVAPGFSAGFGAQQLPYLYRPPGGAPWPQQPGAGAGYQRSAPQVSLPAGQAWAYAQQPQALYQQSAGAGGVTPQFSQQGGGFGVSQQGGGAGGPHYAQQSRGVAAPPFPQQGGAMGPVQLPQQAPSSAVAPGSSMPNGAYQAPPAGNSAWPAGGSTAAPGGPPPTILPPWMIQPQQPASTNNGAQGQGW